MRIFSDSHWQKTASASGTRTRRDTVIQFAVALLLLAPLLAAFWSGGGTVDAFGTSPSAEAIAARRWMLLCAAGRSAQVGMLSAIIAALIGIPAAWLLAGRPMSVTRTALAILPLALPAPVAVSGWVRLIAPSATSSFALQLPNTAGGIVSAAHALLFSATGAGLVLGFTLWPIVALNAWPGFLRARDASYEAARLYGSPVRAFFRAILPRCMGEIAAGVALVFLLACNDFAVSSLLLVHTLPVEVHDQAALNKNAAAAWASLPLVLLAGSLCLLMLRRSTNASVAPHAVLVRGLQSGKFAASIYCVGIATGFAIPMAACLLGVLGSGKALSVSFDAGANSLGLTMRLGAAAVLLSCGFAIVRLVTWPEARSPALNAAGIFLLAIPGGFLGIALLGLQVGAGGNSTVLRIPLAWMALGFALRFLHIPLRLTDQAISGIDPALRESAALLGHDRFSRAMSVTLPLSLGHLAAAAALVFALALGEVPIASVLAPPGAVPATIWLFNQQHMGYDESVFALSLLLGAATAGTVAVGAMTAKWARM